MERQLVLEFVRVTEAGALASARLMGRSDSRGADHAAVEAMRRAMDEVRMSGTIVIGEGERDEAPMLYIGERVGTGWATNGDVTGAGAVASVDIAVDPLEGTSLVARGQDGAISVLAVAEAGGLLHAPDIYMDKLCVGPGPAGKVRIDYSVSTNLRIIADSLGREIEDLTVVVLDRPRHEELIQSVRATGARIRLIADGDLSAAISCAVSGTGDHCVMGSGGAPEGVLAAAALRCLGGQIVGRFLPRNDAERQRCVTMGIDPDRTYDTAELASGVSIIFAATGVTDGSLLKGVRFFGGGARTHSLVMGLESRTIRFVDTVHMFDPQAFGRVRL
jgi:fructose-1,6-bisphosphatase II